MSDVVRGQLGKVGRLVLLLALLVSLFGGSSASALAPIGAELLTRPTATSVTVTMVPEVACRIYYEYGTTNGGPYPMQTTPVDIAAGQANSTVISGLTANTRYYYRMQYSTNGGVSYTPRSQYTFHTKRAAGSTFTFTITSDSHVGILMGQSATWMNVAGEVAADNPEFHFDLGDTVAMYTNVDPGDVAGAEQAYIDQYRYFDLFSHSAPVFLVPGNHEQREGWHVDGTPNDAGDPEDSLPIIGVNAQKKYFPMPVPDGAFYTGDSSTLSYIAGDHLRENYYAWEWGDALFMVIDPFWYTTTKPYVNDVGGGETNGTGSGDAWSWTLGQTQFNWVKTTLQNSTATYKFVFTHQMPTDASLSRQEDYGHAGANHVNLVEMGGYNEAGTTYEWNTKRAGWGTEPLHAIFNNYGVDIVFHGHDHQYAYEKKDNVVYQSVPVSGWGNNQSGFNMYTAGSGYTIATAPNCGHLRVTVAPAQTTVEYIRMDVTTPAHSYTVAGGAPPPSVLGDVNDDGQADSTDALIVLSADVGLDTTAYCPMNCGDVNGNGVVNSTDALIILSFDAGMSVGYPVETGACPGTVTQPDGCSP